MGVTMTIRRTTNWSEEGAVHVEETEEPIAQPDGQTDGQTDGHVGKW